MKNLTKIAMACAFFAAVLSCTKEFSNELTPGWQQENLDYYNVTVDLGGPLTKLAAPAKDSVANNVQIFVFNGSNVLESYYNGTQNRATLRLSSGKKQVRAVVNAPSLGSSVTTLSDLETKVSLFSDNTTSNFVMVGKDSLTVPDVTLITVKVTRLAAKVVLQGIDTEFTAPVYSEGTFTIKKIYLSHAASDCPYFTAVSPTACTSEGELTGDRSMNVTLTKNGNYGEKKIFYAYPNDTDTPTRLVIQAELNGTTYFYPINLGDIKSNTVYNVSNLVITRPGSDNEDDVISTSEGVYGVSIGKWNPEIVKIEEIL